MENISHVNSDLDVDPTEEEESRKELSIKTRLVQRPKTGPIFSRNEQLFIHCCTIFVLSYRYLATKNTPLYTEKFTGFMELMADVCSIPFFDDILRSKLLEESRHRAESFSFVLHINLIDSKGLNSLASRTTEDIVFLVAETKDSRSKVTSVSLELFQFCPNGSWLPHYDMLTKKTSSLMLPITDSVIDNDITITLKLVIIKARGPGFLRVLACPCCAHMPVLVGKSVLTVLSLTPSQITWAGIEKYFPVTASSSSSLPSSEVSLLLRLKWALRPNKWRGGYTLFRRAWRLHDQLLEQFLRYRWRKRPSRQMNTARCDLSRNNWAIIVNRALLAKGPSPEHFFWDEGPNLLNFVFEPPRSSQKTAPGLDGVSTKFCICSEWCSVYSFYYHNPVIKFILGQNQHLFLVPDEYVIPFHFKALCSFVDSKNYVCFSLLSSILKYVHYYISKELKLREGVNEEAFWRTKGGRMLSQGYWSLRDWLNRPESFKSSKRPFDDYSAELKYLALALRWLTKELKSVRDIQLNSKLRLKFQDVMIHWINIVLDNPLISVATHVIKLNLNVEILSGQLKNAVFIDSTSTEIPLAKSESFYSVKQTGPTLNLRYEHLPIMSEVMLGEKETDNVETNDSSDSSKRKIPARGSSSLLTIKPKKEVKNNPNENLSQSKNASLGEKVPHDNSATIREVTITCSKHFSLMHRISYIIKEVEPSIPFEFYDKQLYKTEAQMTIALDLAFRRKTKLENFEVSISDQGPKNGVIEELIRRYYTLTVYSIGYDIQSFLLDHLSFTYYKEFNFDFDIQRIKFFTSNDWIETVVLTKCFTETSDIKKGIKKCFDQIAEIWGRPEHYDKHFESSQLSCHLTYEIFSAVRWIVQSRAAGKSKNPMKKELRFISDLGSSCKSQFESTVKDFVGNIFPLASSKTLGDQKVKILVKIVKAFIFNLKSIAILIIRKLSSHLPKEPTSRGFLLFNPIWKNLIASKEIFKTLLDDTRRQVALLEGETGRVVARAVVAANRQINTVYGSLYVSLFVRWLDETLYLIDKSKASDATDWPTYLPKQIDCRKTFKHILHLHVIIGYSMLQRFSSIFPGPYVHFNEKLDSSLTKGELEMEEINQLVIKIREEHIQFDSDSLLSNCEVHLENLRKEYPSLAAAANKWNIKNNRTFPKKTNETNSTKKNKNE